nr:MAG TPA_asm: 11S regulator activator [Caudoviricetes sp.]
MMKDVVKIKMELEVERNEIEVNFGMAIQEQINKDLTKEEREEIGRLSVEISKIVSKAVKRNIDEELDKISERDPKIDDLFKEIRDELYEQLSDEDKKKVDEFRKKLDNCKTLEDALLLAMEELDNELN